MAYAYPTMVDVAKLTGMDQIVGLIEDNINEAPEVKVFPARTIPGTSFKTAQRTDLPVGQFRNTNEGVEPTKSQYGNKLVECFYYDGQMECDVAVADAHEMGAADLLAMEADGHVRSAIQKIGSQIWYGVAIDAKGFPGAISVVDAAYVLDAGGTTAATGSSVFGVKLGPQYCSLIFGRNSVLSQREWRTQTITRSAKELTAYKNSVEGWVGCQWVNKNAVCQLKDATGDAGKGVTDARLAELLGKLKWTPDYWFMNRRSMFQLQSSRSPIITAGVPQVNTIVPGFAPLPVESNSIPIIVTDSIISTEALT